MSIYFFDSIQQPNAPFFNWCEEFLYLNSISDQLGFHRYKKLNSKDLEQLAATNLPFLNTAAKIVAYFFIFPPLIALAGKLWFRYSLKILPLELQIIPRKKTPTFTEKSMEKFIENKENDSKWKKKWLSNGFLTSLIHIFIEKNKNQADYFFNSDEKSIIYSIKNNKQKQNLIVYNYLINKNHWIAIVLDKKNKCIEWYDSFGKACPQNFIIAAQEIGYPLINKTETKCLQEDSYQCGVWCAYFLEQRILNESFDPLQNIPNIEKKRKEYLLKGYKNHILTFPETSPDEMVKDLI